MNLKQELCGKLQPAQNIESETTSEEDADLEEKKAPVEEDSPSRKVPGAKEAFSVCVPEEGSRNCSQW